MTAILIHIVLVVSHVAIITAKTIILQPEATGQALLIVVKVKDDDNNPYISDFFIAIEVISY